MFCRGYITEKISSRHCSKRSTNCTTYMIIAGRNVCYDRPQNIERCIVTKSFLNTHIGCNLVKGYMPRTFNKYAHIFISCSFYKITQNDKFLYLNSIGCIMDSSRPETITETYCNIVFCKNVEQPVVLFV